MSNPYRLYRALYKLRKVIFEIVNLEIKWRGVKMIEAKILTSGNRELINFITREYSAEKMKSKEGLLLKIERLEEMDEQTLKLCINRIRSLEEFYDPAKSLSAVIGVFTAFFIVLGVFFEEIGLPWYLDRILALGSLALAFIVSARDVIEMRLKKSNAVYFKGLLEYVLERKKENK